MKRRKVKSGIERQFLTALITSKTFLASANVAMDLNLLDHNPFREIAGWCFEYFNTYGEAPCKTIESVFHSWAAEEGREEDHISAVRDLLEALSSSYENAEPMNVPYLLDELGVWLTRKKLERLKDDIEADLMSGRVDLAVGQIHSFSQPNIGKGVGIDPLANREAWNQAFAEPQESIIQLPGKARWFFGPSLCRDGLIGIQGPEKRGKTWWCLEFAFRALASRRKVAIFEVGDLSEAQLLMRIGVRLTGMPYQQRYCGKILVPSRIGIREEGVGEDGLRSDVEFKTIIRKTPLTRRACLRAIKKFRRGLGIDINVPHIKISTHPNSTINVRGISSLLDRWENESGFIPDVIIIDYADILAPEDDRKQARDQVNDTWKALRRLSQEKHCLVIAPTQADASSYDATTQRMKNFSEDKRKLAHVTGMLGLNQTIVEKAENIMRLNWIVLREAAFSERQCLHVGQCIAIGRPLCCSAL